MKGTYELDDKISNEELIKYHEDMLNGAKTYEEFEEAFFELMNELEIDVEHDSDVYVVLEELWSTTKKGGK